MADSIKCSCGCGKDFVPAKRNGINVSKLHPACRWRKEREKAMGKSKQINKKSGTGKVKQSSEKFDFYKTAAWRWFSRYVLLYYSNDDLMVQCATSGVWKSITDKNMHCGHYIKVKDGSKTNYAVSLDFINVGPQTHQENRYHGGRPDVMRQWLVKKHGTEAIEKLEIKSHNILKPHTFWLEAMEKKYKREFSDLMKSRGISRNPWYKKR